MVSNGVLPDFFWINQDTKVELCCLLCHHLLLPSAKNSPKIWVRSRVTFKLAIIGPRPVHWYMSILIYNPLLTYGQTIMGQKTALFITYNVSQQIIEDSFTMYSISNICYSTKQNSEQSIWHLKFCAGNQF
jgi:hypothetical protein